MNHLYKKNELVFSLIWIGAYVTLLSLAESASAALGFEKSITAPFCIAITVTLLWWIKKLNLSEKYGLCAFKGDAKRYIFFLPLIVVASCNLWNGVTMNLSTAETILYILSMLCVGFIEEVIFRGFLFKALCKDNVKQAFLISSVTFGIGHIVNLLNGAEMLATLLQICYAMAVGFLFTAIFYKGKSLIPCIIAHGVTNSLSVFAIERTLAFKFVTAIVLSVVSVLYAIWILKKGNAANKASEECC